MDDVERRFKFNEVWGVLGVLELLEFWTLLS